MHNKAYQKAKASGGLVTSNVNKSGQFGKLMFGNSPLTQKFGLETQQLPVEQGRALAHISQRVSLSSAPKGLYIFDLHLEFDLVVHVPEGLGGTFFHFLQMGKIT